MGIAIANRRNRCDFGALSSSNFGSHCMSRQTILDAAFLLTVGSFLLTVELFLLTVDKFSLFTYSWSFFAYSFSFFAYSFSFFAYSWSFFAYSGKVRPIRALRDCKRLSCTRLRVPPVALHVSRYTCRS